MADARETSVPASNSSPSSSGRLASVSLASASVTKRPHEEAGVASLRLTEPSHARIEPQARGLKIGPKCAENSLPCPHTTLADSEVCS